eukprot:6608288-Alexandrium_andersonii.AAC.1
MVVLARLRWIRSQLDAGMAVTAHASRNCSSGKEKVKFLIGPGAALPDAAPAELVHAIVDAVSQAARS